MLRPSNSLSTSLANVAAHYDISNDVFAAFLSKDMTYSCPIWLSIGDENKNNDTLQKAQLRKIHEVIRQAKHQAWRSCSGDWDRMGKFCDRSSEDDWMPRDKSDTVI